MVIEVRNGLHRFGYVNSWFPVGRTVWGSYEGGSPSLGVDFESVALSHFQ